MIQKSLKIYQNTAFKSTFNRSLRFYTTKDGSKPATINQTSSDAKSEEKKFLIRPNKLFKNPKTFKKIINKVGLNLEDVTSPPQQYHFNPNEYYETIDKVLSDPILKNPKATKHILKKEEIELLSKGSINERPPLVDLPQMKYILDQDLKNQNEEELQKPYRPSGNLLFVTLIRSSNHQMRIVKKSVHQLGLLKIHQTQVHADSPRIRGFVYTCRHLVHVKIVPVNEIFPRGIPTDEMLPEELRYKPKESMIERVKRRSFNRRTTKRTFEQIDTKYENLRKEIENGSRQTA